MNDDLISKQAVDKIINDILENDNLQASSSVWHGLHMIKQLPSAQPTIDAVEVVRCKDCMFSDPVQISEIKCFRCQRLYAYVSDEDFCSRGKRKEQNNG